MNLKGETKIQKHNFFDMPLLCVTRLHEPRAPNCASNLVHHWNILKGIWTSMEHSLENWYMFFVEKSCKLKSHTPEITTIGILVNTLSMHFSVNTYIRIYVCVYIYRVYTSVSKYTHTHASTELCFMVITQTPQGSNQCTYRDNSAALVASTHSPQTRPYFRSCLLCLVSLSFSRKKRSSWLR